MSDNSTTTELHLEVQPAQVSQYLIRDQRTGDWSKTVFGWHGSVQLKWADKAVGAVVTATSRAEDRSEEARGHWAQLLLYGAASLARDGRLSIFAQNDVSDRLGSAEPTTASTSIRIDETFRQKLAQEYETHLLARESFKYAVKCLENFAEHPTPPGYSSEVPAMRMYLERCLAAADLGNMYGWYREKMAGISSSMSELARRKNRNHEGYKRAQDYIRSNLFSFHPPDRWTDRPPTINPQKMAGG